MRPKFYHPQITYTELWRVVTQTVWTLAQLHLGNIEISIFRTAKSTFINGIPAIAHIEFDFYIISMQNGGIEHFLSYVIYNHDPVNVISIDVIYF